MQPHAGTSHGATGVQDHSQPARHPPDQPSTRSASTPAMAAADAPTPTAQPVHHPVEDHHHNAPETCTPGHTDRGCSPEAVQATGARSEPQPATAPLHTTAAPLRPQPGPAICQQSRAPLATRDADDRCPATMQQQAAAPAIPPDCPRTCSSGTAAPAVTDTQQVTDPEARGAEAAPAGDQGRVDLTAQCSHPFIAQVRRKHLAPEDKPAAPVSNRPKKKQRVSLARSALLMPPWLAAARPSSRAPISGNTARHAAHVDSARSKQRLDLRVFPQAQIAAVYVLYALFGTQPSKPVSQIYVSPAHREGLHATIRVRQPRSRRCIAVV